MTLNQLKEKATASELTLIEATVKAVQQQAFDKVLDNFTDLLNERLHPSDMRDMRDMREVQQTIVSCVKQLRAKLHDPTYHEG